MKILSLITHLVSFQTISPPFIFWAQIKIFLIRELSCIDRKGPSTFSVQKESESALFAKCAQTHEEFVVVFKKLLVHTCIHIWHENRNI